MYKSVADQFHANFDLSHIDFFTDGIEVIEYSMEMIKSE